MAEIEIIKPSETGRSTEKRRYLPQSELDLQMMLTNTTWGQSELSPELKVRLNKILKAKTEKGEEEDVIQSLWDLLSFYSRDMRLANLSTISGEHDCCVYYLNLAGDLLQANLVRSFVIALSRAITILELSQSKGGFLRRMMNTFRQEHIMGDSEPQKKSLFGINRREGR